MSDPDRSVSPPSRDGWPGSGFLAELRSPVKAAGIYVHVPFCASRCTYCDFYTLGQRGALSEESARRFIHALEAQMDGVNRDLRVVASTLYLGGGTPSMLGPLVGEIVAATRRTFGFAPNAEVTVEANPDDLSSELLAGWKDSGVTRVSVGIQALDDDVLESFGRRHTTREALSALALLRQSGLRWSADLIAGIPGVSDRRWCEWLQALVGSGATHVSIYPLTVETLTPLAVAIERRRFPEPDGDDAATQMLLAESVLARAGLVRYEIANFAVPGDESQHNLSYWMGTPYLGFGPSAASMLPTADGGRVRFTIHETLEAYLAQPLAATSGGATLGPADTEHLSHPEALREDVMLRLRTSEGAPGTLVLNAGVEMTLRDLESLKLVKRSESEGGGVWRLTEQGWLLGNEVFSRVLFD